MAFTHNGRQVGERYMNNKDYLAHYGIKGQKWGLRRYQNPDGTYTAAGKARRNKGTGKTSYGKGGGNGGGGNSGWMYDNKYADEDTARSAVKADITSRNAKQILDSEKGIASSLRDATDAVDNMNRSRQISKYRETGINPNVRDSDIQRAINRMDVENRFYDQKYRYDTQGKVRASDALKLVGGLTAAAAGTALVASMIRKNNLDAERIKKAIYSGKKLSKEDQAKLNSMKYEDAVKLAQAKQSAKSSVQKAKLKAKTDQALAVAKNLSTDYNKDGTLTDKGRDKLIRQLVKSNQQMNSAERILKASPHAARAAGALIPLASMGMLASLSPAVMAAFPVSGLGGAALAGSIINKLTKTGVNAVGQKKMDIANVNAASIRNRLEEDDRKRRAMAHSEDFLAHYGIKGQKWGLRRYQNADGSYTNEGKIRYGRVKSGNKKTKYGSYYDFNDDYDDFAYNKYVSKANNEQARIDAQHPYNKKSSKALKTAGAALAGVALASLGAKYIAKNVGDIRKISKLNRKAIEEASEVMDFKHKRKMEELERKYAEKVADLAKKADDVAKQVGDATDAITGNGVDRAKELGDYLKKKGITADTLLLNPTVQAEQRFAKAMQKVGPFNLKEGKLPEAKSFKVFKSDLENKTYTKFPSDFAFSKGRRDEKYWNKKLKKLEREATSKAYQKAKQNWNRNGVDRAKEFSDLMKKHGTTADTLLLSEKGMLERSQKAFAKALQKVGPYNLKEGKLPEAKSFKVFKSGLENKTYTKVPSDFAFSKGRRDEKYWNKKLKKLEREATSKAYQKAKQNWNRK